MTTMRLHRLHFSSKLWPLTFAINWPHSQRVSDVSARRTSDHEGDFLILRTIIKIAAKYSYAVLHCQEVSLEGSCSPWIVRCRIITV